MHSWLASQGWRGFAAPIPAAGVFTYVFRDAIVLLCLGACLTLLLSIGTVWSVVISRRRRVSTTGDAGDAPFDG